MKKLLFISLVSFGLLSVSFFSAEGKITKYHSDGIEKVNLVKTLQLVNWSSR
jgi:hypothetical protein